jgi:DNA-binding transcriptional ArsR family regulator
MIFADDNMGKALARFGLKFSKEKPESFSDNYPQIIGIECDVRLKGDQYQKLVDEIRTSKTSEKAIVEPIIVKMTELAKEIKSSIDELSKAKSTQLKEPRDLTKEIESLLAENELTFSQLLATLKTTAPTLSSHLDRMVAENRIERTEVGRNVMYRRKVSE